jgi:hypothetical protein
MVAINGKLIFWEGSIPHRTYTSCGIFNNKWEAEQYFNNVING